MYGPACIIAGGSIMIFGGPSLLLLGIVLFEIGTVGFKLHMLKELQRVGFIKTKKQIISF